MNDPLPRPVASMDDDARRRQLDELKARLEEAEETLDAIRNGEVDAVVVGGPQQMVYTLENADRPYRVLIEQMQEGAITLGVGGTVLYCNDRFSTIVGMPREQILGRSVDRFFRASDVRTVAAMIRNDTTVARAGEFLLQHSSGSELPVNISLVDLQLDESSDPMVCGVVTDLSQNRLRSQELAMANARLGEEVDERRRIEDSLRLALDAADMGSWDLNLETGLSRRSVRHDQIFGYDQPVVRWTMEHVIDHFVPDDRAAVIQAFDEARTEGSLHFERRIHRANDHSIRWVNVQGKTYYHGTRPVRIAGVVSDVTEQRATEEQLRQSQKMEAVGQLTGGIAHDFNNLLLVIGGSLDLLSRRLPNDERMTRLVDAAKAGVSRGAKLNHQLLAFSRRQDLHTEVLNIDHLLPTFEHLLERAVGESIRVNVHPSEDLWLCKTDPHQLETAILNLAINARDAMPDGGRLTLTTGNRSMTAGEARAIGSAPGDYVVISTRDTGNGMLPEVLERAFEPFFTTKEVGKGTGLGLSQVYGFARQSGGFVTIESETGAGTAVLIHLPRTLLPLADPVRAGRQSHPMAHGKEVVLLVEDDDDVRVTASAMLRDLGYEIREARNARHALELIDDGLSVDLVFSDVIMPFGMSGIDLAHELGKRPKPPRILLTSGYTAQRVIPDELANQLRLLRKPYTQPDLSQAIRDALVAV